MKKIAGFWIMLLLPFVVAAQGLVFEQGSFQDALEKARKEQKLVFVDVYTTWCGPCKQMAAQLFPDPKAGDFYNRHFVNFKIDAEKGEGVDIAERYNVAGYPTNLFLRPDGSVVYRVMGAGDLEWFLNNAGIAVEEANDPLQWKDYERLVEQKRPKKEFLERYIAKGIRLGKNIDVGVDKLVSLYISKKPTDEDLKYLVTHNQSMQSKAYTVLSANKERVNTLYASEYPNFFKIYSESLLKQSIEHFAQSNDFAGFEKVVLGYVGQHSVAPNMDKWFFTNYFYEVVGDMDQLETYRHIRASEMLACSDATYQKEDEGRLKETIETLRTQLKASGMPEADQLRYEEQLLNANPQMSKMASTAAALALYQAGWQVNNSRDHAKLAEGLAFVERALQLLSDAKDVRRISFLDTYAHLKSLDGKHEEAVQLLQQAIASAKALEQQEMVTDLESKLQSLLQRAKE